MGGRKRATHCYMGHEYTPENTRTWLKPDGVVHRSCQACRLINDRNRRKARGVGRPNMRSEQKQQCAAMYVAGQTVRELALYFNRDERTIQKLVKKAGVGRITRRAKRKDYHGEQTASDVSGGRGDQRGEPAAP